MSREVYGLWAQRINVGTGASVFIGIPVIPGEVGKRVQWLSGGTCEIVGVSGLAQGLSFFLQASGGGYVLPGTELAFTGPAQFFLKSAGATSVVQVLHELGNGYSQP